MVVALQRRAVRGMPSMRRPKGVRRYRVTAIGLMTRVNHLMLIIAGVWDVNVARSIRGGRMANVSKASASFVDRMNGLIDDYMLMQKIRQTEEGTPSSSSVTACHE